MSRYAKLALACALAALTIPAAAAVPEAYNKMWAEASAQIDANIERCRKADAAIEVVGADGRALAGATVEISQQTHEFLFACNLFALGQLDTPELNRRYEEAFAKLFNFATLPFYWRELEPQPGKPRFAENSERIWRRPPPDQLLKWCKAHGITPKGHALMYAKNKFMPDWTQRSDPAAFQAQARKHMAEIAARYASDIAVWDVVNEEIPRLRHLADWHAVPDDYLAWCFTEAGRLFPKNVKLLINDGTIEAHVTTDAYEAMIKGLVKRGLRVEGIGIQFHTSQNTMFTGKYFTPSAMAATYERLGRLGLPLYITEITVPGVGSDGPAIQGQIVANLYRLWFSTPGMAGVTWWNLGDGTAYENENKALGGLLDKEMRPKAAYQALDKLINHDWKTRLSTKTDPQGKVGFRGFCGNYCVKITVGGKSQQFDICVNKTQPPTHKITFQP